MVREARAAVVEQDQARERSEALEESSEPRYLPAIEEVEVERAEDEVERTLADHLVRDREVATARVANISGLPRRSFIDGASGRHQTEGDHVEDEPGWAEVLDTA